ncbi:MAG TPA: DUF3662 and FHA domain-containing protein [Anaerolineae bacterium]|nr:DUF3662 and FHA domain-containing protein [Anaerolineae bacterium]
MNKLAKFESLAGQWVEGTFSRLLGGRLQPMEVATALARAMEDEQFTADTGDQFAPNVYWVYLNQADYAALRHTQPTLPSDLASSLIDLAERGGLKMPDRPIVEIRSDPAIPARHISVAAKYMAQDTAPISATDEIAQDALDLARSAPKTAMTHSFLILEGRRHVALSKPVITLGRALDNDIVLDDTRVSRHHAQLRIRQGQYILYDTGSSGGSSVNGGPVSEVLLRGGDVISLAGVEIIFGIDDFSATQPASAPDDTPPMQPH